MSKIYLCGGGIIKHNGYPIKNYDFEQFESIDLEFIPFNNGRINSIPYAVSIEYDNGTINYECKHLVCTKWGSDYELQFNHCTMDSYLPPKSLAQATTYGNIGEIIVTAYQDTHSRIVIEGNGGLFYTHTTKMDIQSPIIKTNTMKDKTVIAISGKCCEREYLLILLVSEKINLLYEAIADTIRYSKNNITISQKMHDMQDRVAHSTLTFNGDKYIIESRTYELLSKQEYKRELIPYVVLEAIQSYDTGTAAKYLSSDLNANDLRDFLGEIMEITEPRYKIYPSTSVAVITKESEGNLLATIYEFEMDNNDIITNIIDITK